jgi:hypothetical protein
MLSRSHAHAHAIFIHPAKEPPPDSAAPKKLHIVTNKPITYHVCTGDVRRQGGVCLGVTQSEAWCGWNKSSVTVTVTVTVIMTVTVTVSWPWPWLWSWPRPWPWRLDCDKQLWRPIMKPWSEYTRWWHVFTSLTICPHRWHFAQSCLRGRRPTAAQGCLLLNASGCPSWRPRRDPVKAAAVRALPLSSFLYWQARRGRANAHATPKERLFRQASLQLRIGRGCAKLPQLKRGFYNNHILLF